MAQSGSFASPSSPVREEGGYRRFEHGPDHGFDRDQPWNHHHDSVYPRGNLTPADSASNVTRNDPWSCFVTVLTFCVFGSMTLILGVYGSENIWLGPNSSRLILPNPIFVQSIEAEELDHTESGLNLYGFYKTPSLDVVTAWSDIHYLAVPTDSYKYWIYYLNEGSQINISYKVESAGSSLYLAIAQGTEGLTRWVKDPTSPDSTLYSNVVYGSGEFQQDIQQSSSYYIAVGNLYLNEVKATLDIQVRAVLYNTTDAYYKCTFLPHKKCSLNLLLSKRSYALLTSPALEKNNSSKEFYVKLSYGPRWMTYIFCTGAIAAVLLAITNPCKKNLHSDHEEEAAVQNGDAEPERAPILASKDGLSSWCSSYSSILTSNEEIENAMAAAEGENNCNNRHLCAICFDAPRDCFFLSCGHCVACMQCGTRIAEAAGTCPVCRRKIKKVRKMFVV